MVVFCEKNRGHLFETASGYFGFWHKVNQHTIIRILTIRNRDKSNSLPDKLRFVVRIRRK